MLDWKAVFLTLLVLAGCILLPMFASAVSPWLGVVAFLLACWVWVRVVPAMPGMLQGTICLSGLAFLAGGFLLQAARAIGQLATFLFHR